MGNKCYKSILVSTKYIKSCEFELLPGENKIEKYVCIEICVEI